MLLKDLSLLYVMMILIALQLIWLGMKSSNIDKIWSIDFTADRRCFDPESFYDSRHILSRSNLPNKINGNKRQ